MPLLDHPAAREEAAHLTQTLGVIASEREIASEAFAQASEALAAARRFDPDALPLREMLYARAQQTLHNLNLARKRPYFTRVDFSEHSGASETYYIGKYGVLKSATLEVEVVDWRSPVANLYYSGQIGPMDYASPDGRVTGELTLKRQLGVEDGELKTIFDTGVVSQDAYLQSVLGEMSGDRLREIVTTIQAEQNFVIRHPLDVSLVVQGVAGSGKTTIALHRIAYLLYAFSERLRPEHMLILAPNPLFLSFIAGVLPDLGVERVRQSTFARFVYEWQGKALPKTRAAVSDEEVLCAPEDERERLARVAHVKGSLRMAALLDDFLDRFEERFPPEGDIRFGPVSVLTNERMRRILLVDEKPFPLARREAEFKKLLARRVKESLGGVLEWLETETARRADAIRDGEKDPEKRRERLTKLYQSRDARAEEAKAQEKPFVKQVMARFPSLDALETYRAFWREMEQSEDERLREAARYTLPRLDKTIDPEDLAAVALIVRRLYELPFLDVRHVVVDEAQDFSPLEFLLLERATRSASMTVVGDLMQGIRGWRGMRSWDELTDGLFQGRAVAHNLVTSYRNTVEIMETALRVARKRPVPNQTEAQPVLRHGEKPRFQRFSGAREQADAIAEIVRDWRAQGLSAIAVFERGAKKLGALAKRLPEDLDAKLLDVNGAEYAGGVSLAEASLVKGFEFDGVIVADAGSAAFPDAELDARLLYVLLTRPLHKLAVLYEGALTPLLEGADQ